MRTIIDHLEETLGRIVEGWESDADRRKLPVQIALFPSGPVEGTRTLTTLGLSKQKLLMGDTGRGTRQELVMVFGKKTGHGTCLQ